MVACILKHFTQKKLFYLLMSLKYIDLKLITLNACLLKFINLNLCNNL